MWCDLARLTPGRVPRAVLSFFFSSRRRHTRCGRDWSSDVCSSDLQRQLIVDLREGKGVAYTEALAAAIPKLSGDSKLRARDALAERLARMTADTLRDKLQEDSLEVRRAADRKSVG